MHVHSVLQVGLQICTAGKLIWNVICVPNFLKRAAVGFVRTFPPNTYFWKIVGQSMPLEALDLLYLSVD